MSWTPTKPNLTTTLSNNTVAQTTHPAEHVRLRESIAELQDKMSSVDDRIITLEGGTNTGGGGTEGGGTGGGSGGTDGNGIPLVDPVPSGYDEAWIEDFSSATTWLKSGGGSFAPYVMQQSGTASYNTAANAYVDESLGILRLRTQAQTTNSRPYGSGYVGTNQGVGGGTEAKSYFPLVGRYEAMVRYPMAHSIWNSCWLNYRGSAGWSSTLGFEIDFAEMFTAMAPGRVRCQCHKGGIASYGGNLLGSGKGQTTWHIPPSSSRAWSGTTAATYWSGGTDVDFDDPAATAGPTNGQTGWHKAAVEVFKVTGSAGYTIGITWYLDDVKLVTWIDPSNPDSAARPPWIDGSASEDYAWDIRFDSWVGGDYIGQSWDGSNRIFTYNGKRSDSGVTGNLAAVGTVPNATLWSQSTSNNYYLDVAWVRVLTPNGDPTTPDPTPTPPAGSDLLFNVDLSAYSDEQTLANPTTYAQDFFYGRYNTPDNANEAISVELGQSAPDSAPALEHMVNSTGRYAGAYWRSGTSGETFPALYAREYFKVTALPSVNAYILEFVPQAGGTALANVRLTTAGKLVARVNNAGTLTDAATSTTTISTGTWYCLEMALINGNDSFTVRLRDASGTLLEEMYGAYTAAAEPGRVSYGIQTTTNAGSPVTVYTALHAADDGDWIGPV